MRRNDRRYGRKSGSSKIEAMASRQRDWRMRAKSLIASRIDSMSAAMSRRRASPSPLHVEPSTISRSAPERRSTAAGLLSGGSPGHQTVTGRSWTTSGVAIADRWRPASPPAVTWIVSAHVSGASSRGRTQCASTRASSQEGPSGSAAWMTIVRDGCRPVSSWMVAAQRSASSGRRATTTRFITLVRAATRRPPSSSSSVCSRRSWPAQIRASSLSISAIECAREEKRSVGSPILIGASIAITPVLRSAAIGGRGDGAARRLPSVPRSPRRSSGIRAPARTPTIR